MSHNLVKANSKTADRASTISVELSDLSDVSTTAPTTGQALTWGGAQWEPTTSSGAGGNIFIGEGASVAYYSSATNPANNVDVYFYDTSPHNSISGATINSTSNWIDSVTLPTGSYMLESCVALSFSTTGNSSYEYHNGTSFLGQVTYFGSTDFEVGTSNRTVIEITAASLDITVRLVSTSNLNTTAAQGNRQAERSFFSIMKIS